MPDYRALLTPDIVGSFPQETDYIYAPTAGPLAPFGDLKRDVFEVDDQGQRGTCVANAATSVPEDMLKKDGRGMALSRLLNDWVSRNLILEQPGIEGSTMRAGIRAAKHFGLCEETTWPYDLAKFDVRPTDEAFAEAIQHVIQRYERIDNDLGGWPPIGDLTEAEWRALIRSIIKEKTIKGVKSALNEGLQVAFSCQLGEQWFGLTGPWQAHEYIFPSSGNPVAGGHAMVCIGYDSERVLIENSWGPQWGDGGFGGMPYDSFANSLMEAFVVRGFDGIYINDPLQAQWDQIQKLYLGFYGRPADLGGMLYWRDRLINEGLSAIVEAFMTSAEAQDLYSENLMKEANRATRRNI